MSVAVLVFTWRKPGLSKAEFMERYESIHVPQLRELTGADFPLVYRRVYTDSHADGAMYRGSAENASYDCMAEVVFEDEAHLNRFNQTLAPHMSRVIEDEQRFSDTAKTVAVRSMKVVTSLPEKHKGGNVDSSSSSS